MEHIGGKKLVQYGDNVVEVNDTPRIPTIISTTGIKPAQSRTHEYLRRVLLIVLICVIIWGITHEEPKLVCIQDLEPAIKKDSLLYQTIQEIDDEDAQQKYLKSLKHTLDADEPSLMKKYSKAIKIALIAGIYSEYVINGNIVKPIGIIAKTVVYAAIATTITE